jgi:hypothetical protein
VDQDGPILEDQDYLQLKQRLAELRGSIRSQGGQLGTLVVRLKDLAIDIDEHLHPKI